MDFSQPGSYEPIGPSTTGGPEASGVPCQRCGGGPARIETYMWVMSFVILTRHLEYQANLCRSCATRTGFTDQAKSALLGWWGIPWGLLTFKALWVNARSLARWSTLPKAVGPLVLVAGLAVPFLVSYALWVGGQGERGARQTGDWVDQEVVELVDQGHDLYDQGRVAEAVERCRTAQKKAPRSSVVNASLAQSLVDLGRYDEALPFAANAARYDPGSLASRARHGFLLAKVEGRDAARKQEEILASRVPADEIDAVWMADFFDGMGRYDEELRVARAGLELAPGSPPLVGRELAALVHLERLDEAGARIEGLDEETGQDAYVQFASALYGMRGEPVTEVARMCSEWVDYSESAMVDLTRMAERTGRLAEARDAVRRCLADPATPGEAWAVSRPWFEDTWTEELDRHVARRPEPMPVLLRLQLYDGRSEAAEIRRLASRVDAPDHPLVQYVDSYRYAYGLPDVPIARRAERLAEHVEAVPDHALCRSILAGLLARGQPDRAEEHLRILDEAGFADPSMAAQAQVARAEIELVRGDAAAAKRTVLRFDPDELSDPELAGLLDLSAAEAAFHEGDSKVLRARLRRAIISDDPGIHAAALVIRWIDQLANGEPITYRQDVDHLLERHGDALLAERSPSAQGILIAEGRIEAAERVPFVPPEQRGTLALVEAFRARSEAGSAADLGGFRAVAGTGPAYEFAPFLARTALERRGGGDA